jgi:hypothetical protein
LADVHRSSIAFVLVLAGCGPSPGDPMEDDGDGSSEANDSVDPDSSGAADESTTSPPPNELPPEARGNWLCTGSGDPIYVRLVPDEAMPWNGTACGPDPEVAEPSEWTNCADLGFGHPNGTGTQAYWTFVLEYEAAGGPEVSIDLGVDYVADTDTLEGFLFVNDPPSGYLPESCTRDAG